MKNRFKLASRALRKERSDLSMDSVNDRKKGLLAGIVVSVRARSQNKTVRYIVLLFQWTPYNPIEHLS